MSRRDGVASSCLDIADDVDVDRVGLGLVLPGSSADEVAGLVASEELVVIDAAVGEVAAEAGRDAVVAGAAEEAVGFLAYR